MPTFIIQDHNGYSKKTLKTSFGETEIKVPRDRDGELSRSL